MEKKETFYYMFEKCNRAVRAERHVYIQIEQTTSHTATGKYIKVVNRSDKKSTRFGARSSLFRKRAEFPPFLSHTKRFFPRRNMRKKSLKYYALCSAATIAKLSKNRKLNQKALLLRATWAQISDRWGVIIDIHVHIFEYICCRSFLSSRPIHWQLWHMQRGQREK